MKHRILSFSVILLLLISPLLNSQQEATAQPFADTIEKEIQASLDNFKKGDSDQGAARLVNVVLLTKPLSAWPKDFVPHMHRCKAHFSKCDFGNAVEELKNARIILQTALNIKVKYNFQQSHQVVDNFRNALLFAKDCYQNGNPE